jgi:hypothetical protein
VSGRARRRGRLRAGLAAALAWLGGCGAPRPLVVDRVPPELPPDFGGGAPAILIFSKTADYRHEDAIPACEAAVRAIAARRGWSVFATENAAVFNDAQLARVDVVVGNNATGDNWTDDQKAAFRRFVEGGGGFVGVHGAGGTPAHFWDWYQGTLIGAHFLAHPALPDYQTATVVVEHRDHPATRHLGASWVREDEWYSFEENPRERGVLVLLSLDEKTYRPRQLWRDISMGDHPIAWSHCVGRGRSFFSALGHKGSYYAEPDHAVLIEGAIAWAAGLEGDCGNPIAPR